LKSQGNSSANAGTTLGVMTESTTGGTKDFTAFQAEAFDEGAIGVFATSFETEEQGEALRAAIHKVIEEYRK